MAGDASRFDVTIIRPKADEDPRDIRIGLTILARMIAGRIRERDGQLGMQATGKEEMRDLQLLELGDET